MRKLVLISISVLIFANVAHADFFANLQSSNDADPCSPAIGHWSGGGPVETKNHLVKCNYHGEVDIVNAAQPGAVKVHVDLRRDGGSELCPSHETEDLPGVCSNGNLILKTNDADFQGSLNSAGTQAVITGSVSFVVDIIGKVTVLVKELKLNKQ